MQVNLRAVAAAALLSSTALTVAAGARAEELTGTMALYGWLPQLDGTTTSRSSGRSVETSISRGDLLKSLDFGMMGAGELNYGRYAFLFDTVYSKLSNGGSVSAVPALSTDVNTKMLLSTFAFGYQAYKENGVVVEPYAGVRYVWMNTDVKVSGGPIGLGADIDVHWWDPLVGVRGRLPLDEKWAANGIAEVGGFGVGSDVTWQLYAGVEYAVSEKFTANAGFRYLAIRYSANKTDIDINQYGPLLGMTYRF